jgi:hypothetical protein
MYNVDDKDRVIKLDDVPQSSVGAPLPVVLSDEGKTLLAYLRSDVPDDWDGSSIRIVGYESEWPIVIVEFKAVYALMSGPPNDEAFSGHPLYERGLHPYAAFEIINSSWIRGLEKMNSVHEYHRPERFEKMRHFVFAFHDSTLECVADGFEVSETKGSMRTIFPGLVDKFFQTRR